MQDVILLLSHLLFHYDFHVNFECEKLICDVQTLVQSIFNSYIHLSCLFIRCIQYLPLLRGISLMTCDMKLLFLILLTTTKIILT